YRRVWNHVVSEMRWLTPGLGVKRWIGVILAGTTLVGVGFAILILDIYRNTPDTWWLPIISTLSLRFLDRTLRAVVFGGSGLALILLGTWGLNRALLKPFMRPGKPILDTVTAYRKRERGPHIVVIGGGTGLSSLLRGLKQHTNNLTAIVTVADDGGSSGELRRNIGILPPGDIRNCLAAMSDDEDLLTQIFQYRFSAGAGLNGHSLGNLFITALADITGSFEEAVAESGRVLAVKGRVLPSTLHDVRLVAEVQQQNGSRPLQVKGESEITKANGHIQRVWLEPNNPLAFPPALQAILSADLIVIGPGSLFTSIIPNLLVPDLADAIRASRALKFYVCNVASQSGETDGFTCDDHVNTIERHFGGRLFDLMVCNNNFSGSLPANADWIRPGPENDQRQAVYYSDLLDQENTWRHDSQKLAQVVMDLFYERTGPLVNREELNIKV
ncbi:MAG: YvcK family protein, partial [Anaerolineaceae bacterium]|nr:YvcK family protein [Anaerolineaceae bacterium]